MRWDFLNTHDSEAVLALSQSLQIDEKLSLLLYNRGIKSFEEAKNFFRPSKDQLHDPMLMRDMDKAINRIADAFEKKENILVYGDYDVDGTTSVAVVYSYLISAGINTEFYIPDRYEEGYGISFKGIDYAVENNFSLIIALDCGIKALDKIKYANEKGVDFIICDHHLPGEQLPDAVAVLDPKRSDCNYPYKELPGCGIGYKLICAIHEQLLPESINPNEFLDFVAVAIAADIVPITGENRVLCFLGLEKINQNPSPGFRTIIKQNSFKKALTVSDLVFVIAPRINAAGRIKHARDAVKLLIAINEDEALPLANQVNEINTARKELDQDITAHAIQILENDVTFVNRKSTVVFHESWHKGVVGIVASRLVEKFYKPTIVLTKSNEKLTGSARSVQNFDVYEAIEACGHLLEQFGGHKYAAGLTMHQDKFLEFSELFDKVVSSKIQDHHLSPGISIDTELNFVDITPKFFRILKQFAPFGPGNMNPLFCTNNVVDNGWAKIVGNNHLKLELYQEDNPSIKFSAIGFDLGDYLTHFQKKLPLSIVYSVEENVWNGVKNIQLVLKDIKII